MITEYQSQLKKVIRNKKIHTYCCTLITVVENLYKIISVPFHLQALIQLAEFDRAKQALNKAKECKPRDKDILAAFQELER